MHNLFLILAAVSFLLAALKVQAPVDFLPLGFMFTVLMIGF
jgi:hypothetical protein